MKASEIKLEQRIMRRIRIASFFLGLSFAKIFLVFLTFLSAGELFWNISFFQVFQNAPRFTEFSLHQNFWQSAWSKTELGVQIAIVLLCLTIMIVSALQIARLRRGSAEKLPEFQVI